MKPGRLISPPGTYFVTFSTWQRQKLFLVENYVRLFLKTVYRYRREGRFLLHAFVVMPEHAHLLLTPANDVTLEHAVQLIKGGYSHALGEILGRKREIWQRGFVNDPTEYRYGSAFPGFRLDPPPSAAKAELSKSA